MCNKDALKNGSVFQIPAAWPERLLSIALQLALLEAKAQNHSLHQDYTRFCDDELLHMRIESTWNCFLGLMHKIWAMHFNLFFFTFKSFFSSLFPLPLPQGRLASSAAGTPFIEPPTSRLSPTPTPTIYHCHHQSYPRNRSAYPASAS